MEYLSYEEFKERAKNEIRAHLPEDFREAEVQINEFLKNNVKLDGLTVRKEGATVTPVVYLQDYYPIYTQTGDITDTLDKMADTIAAHDGLTMDPDVIRNWNYVKERLTARLINVDTNRELLETVPYTPFNDLAVTYHVVLQDTKEGIASTRVTNELLEQYGVSVEELHKEAMLNLAQPGNWQFEDLGTFMAKMMGEAEQEMMRNMGVDLEHTGQYILTNQIKQQGVALIANKDVQQMIAWKLGELAGNRYVPQDYYVIPSSVHEVLVVPQTKAEELGLTVEDLSNMVQEVNQGEVAPEDQLSDRVYEYNAQTKTLSIAGDRELLDEMKNQAALDRAIEQALDEAELTQSAVLKR